MAKDTVINMERKTLSKGQGLALSMIREEKFKFSNFPVDTGLDLVYQNGLAKAGYAGIGAGESLQGFKPPEYALNIFSKFIKNIGAYVY